jgi:hypothetical protein
MEESMKTLQISIVLCVVILLCGAAFAQQSTAPTITFNVPLHLQNLHQEVTGVSVTCNVFSAGNHIVGVNGIDIPVPANGNVNQTVTIVVTQKTGEDITLANSYNVLLGLNSAGVHGEIPSQSPDMYIRYRAKEGTQFVPQLSGPITW